MSLDPISALLDLGAAAIKRIWPDPAQQAEEQRKLAEVAQRGDLAELNAHVQLMLGQIDINREEAKSGSLFVAGWRPWIGWVSGVALAIAYVPKALMLTVMWSYAAYTTLHGWNPGEALPVLPDFPDLGITDLIGLLGAMLGVGGLRSYDKRNGTDTKKIRREGE